MRSHLKVKVFSLAAEMKYIHRQEVKWKDKARAARLREKQQSEERNAKAIAYCEINFWSQRDHRLHLKLDARWSHLAYGFMKGRAYSEMEYICYGCWKGYGSTEPDWARVEEIVTNFSKDEPEQRDIMQKFSEWKAAALVWFEGNPKRIAEFWKQMTALREEQAANPEYQAARQIAREAAKELGQAMAADGWVKRGRKWHNPNDECRDLGEALLGSA